MVKLTFISNRLAKKHSTGTFHPESPHRIDVIEEWIQSQTHENVGYELLDQSASREDILLIHSADHYNLIEKTQGYTGHFHFDADTAANSYTFKAATQAVAVGKKAILESTVNSSIFALVRPPGHHATRTSPGGFCIFNNIAIAAELVLHEKKYDRVAIIDFDHHFGNGTAYIHEKNPNILYISTHADPRISYPGCGFVEEIGEAEGRGYNISIPLGYRSSEADIKFAFEELILPVIQQFQPNFLAISAGFDAFEKDPIGVLGVTSEGFSMIGAYILKISSELNIPFANFLEGGYNIYSLPKLISSYISPFIQDDQERNYYDISLHPNDQTIATVNRAKNILSDYWQL
ncbi:MAG: histone deacetylase [Candidatus Heimdallarchaeota archaeon]|nr:MAG: histone deacetylase [Candidatus Heimdallarchaeota archaeon]